MIFTCATDNFQKSRKNVIFEHCVKNLLFEKKIKCLMIFKMARPVCSRLHYLKDSRQEFAKVGGIFPIFHAVVLLDPSN